MIKNIGITVALIKYSLKSMSSYKKDFIIGIIIVLVNTLFSLLFIEVLYNSINSIANWSKYEIILIYAISSINMAFYNIFCGNYRSLKTYIFTGELETMLTKPLNIILHLKIREIDVQPVVDIVVYASLLFFCLDNLKVSVSAAVLIKTLILSALGIMFMSSVMLTSLSFLFYTRYTYTPYDSVMMTVQLADYPINIYSGILKNIILTVFPVALMGYLPADTILMKDSIPFNKWVIFIVLIYHFVSKIIFRHSLKRYDGIGS